MIYLLLAFFTGIILVVQMYMNSQLSTRLDPFNGVFYNYFIATIVFALYFITKPGLFLEGSSQLSAAKPHLFLGGILGIAVVSLCNLAYKKLSATYTTSLIILGQLGAAMLIDNLFLGITIAPKEVIGILLIVGGIGYNTYINSKKLRV